MSRVACRSGRLFSNGFKRCQTELYRCHSTHASLDEISHFKQLAPTWWDTHGSQRILHLMNLSRLDFIQRVMRHSVVVADPDVYVPGFNHKEFLPFQVNSNIDRELEDAVQDVLASNKLRVLDIGCGGGILAESLGRLPYIKSVLGIDLASDCITVAQQHALLDPVLEGKVSYKLQAIEDVEGRFDMVTCFEMLEHTDVPSEILRHAWDRLNPGGILFLSTINRDPVSWFTTIFMAEKVLKVVPLGTHHLSKYINSKEILEWFAQNERPGSYELLDKKGTMYLPLKGWVEHDCPDVGNYIMAIKKTAKS